MKVYVKHIGIYTGFQLWTTQSKGLLQSSIWALVSGTFSKGPNIPPSMKKYYRNGLKLLLLRIFYVKALLSSFVCWLFNCGQFTASMEVP